MTESRFMCSVQWECFWKLWNRYPFPIMRWVNEYLPSNSHSWDLGDLIPGHFKTSLPANWRKLSSRVTACRNCECQGDVGGVPRASVVFYHMQDPGPIVSHSILSLAFHGFLKVEASHILLKREGERGRERTCKWKVNGSKYKPTVADSEAISDNCYLPVLPLLE